jgi:hypothetical protein
MSILGNEDYLPEVAYSEAESLLDELLETNPAMAEEIIEMLDSRLAEEINSADMSEDEDEASAQLRNIVLRLQTLAFLAGAYWKGLTVKEQSPEESLSIELTDAQKLELTRNLLNGDGISLKIL